VPGSYAMGVLAIAFGGVDFACRRSRRSTYLNGNDGDLAHQPLNNISLYEKKQIANSHAKDIPETSYWRWTPPSLGFAIQLRACQ
jgi:hypothetical protein